MEHHIHFGSSIESTSMLDEDAAERSRVLLVSARRRPSDESSSVISDVDVYRSSVTSHVSTHSTHAAVDWQKPARLHQSRKLEEKLEEERHSLPTLENHLQVSSASGSGGATNTSAAAKKMKKKRRELVVTSTNTPASTDDDSVYYAPHSPPFSSTMSVGTVVKSTAGSQAKSVTSHQERMTTVLTEVGETYQLPLFRKDTLRDSSFSTTKKKKKKNKLVRGLEKVIEAPHVTMEESQKYTFAIVLRHTDQVYRLLRHRFPSKSAASIRRDLHHQVGQLQQKCVRRLIQAGLGVIILDNDLYGRQSVHREEEEEVGKNICILVDPKKDKDLLLHEFKREMDELSVKNGDSIARLGEESLDSIKEMCFSPALELQLTHNIIQNAFKDYDKEEWVIDVNKELTVKDIIHDCFPLHDRAFNKKFFAEYRRTTFDLNPRKAATGNANRWAVEELRLHFGERVAFLFAFMHIYTKHLMPLTLICVIYYLSFRFASSGIWKEYLEGLAILGFGVACFWGPSFLICWERETRILVEKWNLTKYQNTVYERNDYNPSFQYLWVKNELTKEMEKVPKTRKNHWIQLTMLFFVLVSALIQCICLLPFIQWYVYAKNAPQCSACYANSEDTYSCIWFMTCFNSETSSLGTDRWVYILVQGIALGLLIDIIFFEVFNWISEKFVKWENYAKKSDFENRLIHRRFVFVWSNWFFWFLFLAFVYLPFGEQFLNFFHKIGLGVLAPYSWDPTLLTLDTLFVTPLVVTQFLNMLLETIVPYLMRKLRGRPVVWRKAAPVRWCGKQIARLFQARKRGPSTEDAAQDEARNLTAKRLASLVQKRTDFAVEVLPMSDDSNQYSAYEIIAESKLPVFDPMSDYLDACIQFSYVIMFTVVWPLLPFPAFFNNLLEVRGDAFRLLFAHRRPMPRRDTSIGEWLTVLQYANIIGVTVVMCFIVVYHWGYFVTGCNFTFDDGDMVPFGDINMTKLTDPDNCDNKSGESHWTMVQIILFVLLEHIGFCFRYLVLQVEKTPSAIRSSGYQRLKQIQQLTNTRTAKASQFEYVQNLRRLFEKHDIEGDGHLRETELISFLAEWICKHPSELLPYSSIIFRYMDKNGLGKVPFATCCLMMQHVNHDRFFSCLLGIYDPMHGDLNNEIQHAADAMEFRRVMSAVSSVVSERRSSIASLAESITRPRDSTFFYVNS